MKNKMVFLIAILLISLSLAACGAPTEPEPAEPTAETEPAVEEETEVEVEPVEEAETEEEQDAEPEEESEPVAAIDGAAIYASNCAGCHGADRSGNNGPALLPDRLSPDAAVHVEIITNGRGGMPAFSDRLTAEEIDAVVSFILTEPE